MTPTTQGVAKALYALLSITLRLTVLLWAALVTDGPLSFMAWLVFGFEGAAFLVGVGIGVGKGWRR